MKIGCIYKVRCLKNNNFLYGSTTRYNDRMNTYLSGLQRNIWSNKYLQNCYNKYGKENIEFKIVQNNIPENILEYVEDIWIGANKGRIEDKKGGMNVRDASRVRFSEETKIKMKISNKGKKKSGIPLTFDHKKLLSISHLGKIFPNRWIPINQINKYSGEIIKEWKNAMDINKKLNYNLSNINSCCKNNRKTANGYIWKYKNN